MKIKLSLFISLILICTSVLKSQTINYIIKKAPFSSDLYDEFSPVFYKEGVVFGSNREGSSLVDYSGNEGKGPVSIFYVERKNNKDKWKKAKIFSKNLTSKFNDGPASFNQAEDVIYYSRNMIIFQNHKDNPFYRNKLGLFSATKTGKKWSNVTPFRHNNDWFNITTPFLSPDGLRLYFSSDKPDGYGGADLYFSEWKNGYWGDPVNMGPTINTPKNEAYPFVNEVGELFFSSDGHPGLGGKDIFVTKAKEDDWYAPIALSAPINSVNDDFGILTDALMDSGFFTSKRDRTLDIYSFNTQNQSIWFSNPQQENNYCVNIPHQGSAMVDTLLFQYEWDLGNDKKTYGENLQYCFEQKGIYNLNLNIVDRSTKRIFFHLANYQVEIEDIEQPYIHCDDCVLVGESMLIDAFQTNFPNDEVLAFYWQLSDTTFKQGAQITHEFNEPGDAVVELAVTLKSISTGRMRKLAVSKTIRVFDRKQDKDRFLAQSKKYSNFQFPVGQTSKYEMKTTYRADGNLPKESVFRLQLLKSDKKVPLNDPVFGTIPSKFKIRELFDSSDSSFIYVVDEQSQLVSLFPIFKSIQSNGYGDATVTYGPIKEQSEKELFRLKEKYSTQLDDFFNSRNVLMTNGVLMLNKLVDLMSKYPGLKIEVSVHTDNVEKSSKNLYLSEYLANNIVDYLVSSGINKDRLLSKGKGEDHPIRSNLLDTGRAVNRRVEFIITEH